MFRYFHWLYQIVTRDIDAPRLRASQSHPFTEQHARTGVEL